MNDAERQAKAGEYVEPKVAARMEIAARTAKDGLHRAFLAGCEAESESLSSVMVALDKEARELRRKLARAESQVFNLATLSSPKPAAHQTASSPVATLLMYHAPGWTYSYTAPPTCGECAHWGRYKGTGYVPGQWKHCREVCGAVYGATPVLRHHDDHPIAGTLCTFTPRPPKSEPADDGFALVLGSAFANDDIVGVEAIARHCWDAAKRSQDKDEPKPEPDYSRAYADHGADDGFKEAFERVSKRNPIEVRDGEILAGGFATGIWNAAKRSQAKDKQPGEES